MTTFSKTRIDSIDLLKGLVMVIMALDHVRDYFHYSAFIFDPGDPTKSTLPIFFTRFITHFCAPAFSFLAGTSAYLGSKKKTPNERSAFLVKRGIWLVFTEMSIVIFAWTFNIHFPIIFLSTIWSLGVSMIVLALLSRFSGKIILGFSLLIIFGHNLLDNTHFPGSIFWASLHEQQFFELSNHRALVFGYPLIPWIGVMSLGYYFGTFYESSFEASSRKRLFNFIGITALIIFGVLRFTNFYGDPKPFIKYETVTQDLISFFNPTKYPASLLYLLMTLGAAFLFLANVEKWKGKMVNFFCTFGRVPFFYYILHLYLMHLIALLFAQLSGFGWHKMVLSTFIVFEPNMQGYGFPLWVVYLVWVVLILLLYPLCKWFDTYKQTHKEKWWLSYL